MEVKRLMADLLYVAVTVIFFLVGVLFARGCARLWREERND
jgi:hypothetical protein